MYNPPVAYNRQIYRTQSINKTIRLRKMSNTVRNEPKRFLQRAARIFGCVDCGERHVSCLSFYMNAGIKIKAIRIRHCKTIEETKQELSQGFVLCKNCHKKKTAPIRPNNSWLRIYKMNQGCAVCKTTDADVLELHHMVQSTKHFDVSKHRCSVPKSVLNNELKKVTVLCSNCHAKEHSD